MSLSELFSFRFSFHEPIDLTTYDVVGNKTFWSSAPIPNQCTIVPAPSGGVREP